MLVSYNWLQRFFDEKLPSPEEIAEKLTFGAFEIESIEHVGLTKSHIDAVIDVKVLPDRACYALSHRGIAREISTLTGIPMKHDPLRESYPELSPKTSEIVIAVEDATRVPYYSAALVRNISVGPSPDWLKKHLESVGQQSINNVVDAANFVMLELGTPLHVFDADKLSRTIAIRAAKQDEKINILGGEEKTLSREMTVIADGEKDVAIAIAGVKGERLRSLRMARKTSSSRPQNSIPRSREKPLPSST